MGDAQTIALAVRTSLSALHASGATPELIKQAEKSLLDVTKALQALNPVTCLEVVQLLLAPLLSPTTADVQAKQCSLADLNHGFHLLDEVLFRVNNPWASFPDDVRANVRQLAVQLFQNASEVDANGTRIYGFPQLVMEKITALLSAVAVREWPQRWNTFLDELLSEPRRAETCCHVLRVMSEEVHDYGAQIENRRREDLRHAMALTLSKTLGFVTGAADAFHQQKNYRALNTALDTIQAFLSWASLHEVFSVRVPDACFLLLRFPETRDRALAALTTLVKRNFTQAGNLSDRTQNSDTNSVEVQSEIKFRDTVFGGLLEFVMGSSIRSIATFSFFPPTRAIVPALADSYAEGANNSQEAGVIDEEEHEFQVAFFTMLSELGCTNFCNTFLFSKQRGAISLSPAEQQRSAGFVEVMLCACASPSCSIRLAVVPFFTTSMATITKHLPTLGGSIPLHHIAYFMVTGYLQAASLALIRFPPNVDKMATLFEEMDFVDDPRREKDRYENLISRTVSAISAAAKLCPEFAGRAGLKRLVRLLSGKPNISGEHGNGDATKHLKSAKSQGFILPDEAVHGWDFGKFGEGSWMAWECCLHATLIATEAMVSGASASSSAFGENARDEMEQLMLKSFELAMAVTEKPLLPHKTHALRILFPLYVNKPQLLEVTFRELISQGTNLAGVCRHRACLAISMLCKRLASTGVKHLENYREPMCTYTSRALSNRTFGSLNKIHLLEASINTIVVTGDFSEQTEFVERLMDPVLRDLESDGAKLVLQNPVALVKFISSGDPLYVAHICEAFQLMESSTHQIVRPASKIVGPISLPNVLSHAIAPRCVEVAASLVRALHGMYNGSKFPLNDAHGIHQGLLLPTSRELTALLNLESGARWRREHVHERARVGEDEQQGSVGEQTSSQILRQYGIEPPDPQQNQKRETLKNLRKAGYELMRSAIFSGLTNSEVHLESLLSAVTMDCYHLEPIHLVEVTNKVLRPLLSYPVVSAGAAFLEVIERSTVPNLLHVIQEHIECAKLGEIVDTNSPLVNVARDYGRKSLARSAVDLMCSMYPRLIPKKGGDVSQSPVFMPPVFNSHILGDKIVSLWRVICSPGQGFLDSTTANLGFKLIADAVAVAPDNRFDVFGPLLEASFRTSVENHGLKLDSPFDYATGAVLSVIRKWPVESKAVLQSASNGHQQVSIWITECIDAIVQSSQKNSKPKKHKGFVVELVGKTAKLSGFDSKPESKVKALPEKLVTNNPARSMNRVRNELEEIVLGDVALDSLFGDGNPL